jgi:hypothetical protein
MRHRRQLSPSDAGSRVIGGCRPFTLAVHPMTCAVVWSVARLRDEEALA